MKTLLLLLLVAGTFGALAQNTAVSTNPPPAVPVAPTLPPLAAPLPPPEPAPTNSASPLTLTDPSTGPIAREVSPTLVTPDYPTTIKVGRDTLGGAGVQAVTIKKPWQLLNPFAPMRYGPGTNNLVPNSAGGAPGLSIFSCSR
jgi:hypothetical protein